MILFVWLAIDKVSSSVQLDVNLYKIVKLQMNFVQFRHKWFLSDRKREPQRLLVCFMVLEDIK